MEIKRIAITGHTDGIGSATYELLSKEFEVEGFSRSNGYDISTQQGCELLIEHTRDYDLFINNAYHYDQQSVLAQMWEAEHRNQSHFILNISSLAADPMFDVRNKMPWLTEYSEEKQRLNRVSFDITDRLDVPCKSMTLMVGIVDNSFDIFEYYGEDSDNRFEKMPAFLEFYNYVKSTNRLIKNQDVAQCIRMMIQSIQSNCFMYSVSLFNRF